MWNPLSCSDAHACVTQNAPRRCTIEMSECVSAVLFSPSAAYVVLVGWSSAVSLYDASTAQCCLCIAAEYPAPDKPSLFQLVRGPRA